jgi:hypothetical protein
MHWFWRGVIAVGTALVWTWLERTIGFVSTVQNWVYWSITGPLTGRLRDTPFEAICVTVSLLTWNVFSLVIAVLVYGLLTRFAGGCDKPACETRCRKCRYILRGITEPRCPECGEEI